VQDLVGPPENGRTFAQTARAGLADCAPTGRVRLDALARWLQDVAYGDVEDAGLAEAAIWVVRKTRMNIIRFPRFSEHHRLVTFCSGLGKMWAERRTTIFRDDVATVEAVSLWVHLDPVSRRPAPFTDAEVTAYGDAAAGRRVTARLRHGPPEGVEDRGRWVFRATERDLAEHINNAAYWQPLEEQLLAASDEPERLDVEIEFRSPAQPGEKLLLTGDDGRLWITDPDGDVHASLYVAPC
jgi:acyl-ACP thioesterase